VLYHFHSGSWRLAWRILHNVCRIIMELGLNRKIVLDRAFTDDQRRNQAINSVWTVFVLDQHLSHALGFTNALSNLRFEDNFPWPVRCSLPKFNLPVLMKCIRSVHLS
jgi:hypothetical protein